MSSVTRFIRQIAPSTSYYKATDVVAAASTSVYEFTPAAGNVIGNYPPGTMATASSALQTAIAAQAANTTTLILRDMGKTIRATIASNGNVGYFRQVQLLAPNTAGNGNEGVLGTASAYLTFYVPITIMGSNADAAHTLLHAASQM